MPTLKEQLHQLCADYIDNRETEINRIISEAREAAGDETKSSAGDKYETSREMMQQEINMNLSRLSELNKLRNTLDHILPTQEGPMAVPGSVVYTNNGNFYLAISAGVQRVDGKDFYAVSAASPIGSKMVGQTAGYVFELNGKRFVIEEIV